MLSIDPLDYQETQFNFREKYKKFRHGFETISEDQIARVPHLRLFLKNAIMHSVAELRFKSKRNSLMKVLKKGVKKMIEKKK